METITADSMTLMRQASMTANEHMIHCVRYIDEKFGEGYAKGQPELLAAMIQASAQDYHTSCLTSVMQGLDSSMLSSLDGVAKSIGTIAKALDEVAGLIESHE